MPGPTPPGRMPIRYLSPEDEAKLAQSDAVAYATLEALEGAVYALERGLAEAKEAVQAQPLPGDADSVADASDALEAYKRASDLAFFAARLAGVRAYRDALLGFHALNGTASAIANGWLLAEEEGEA